MFFSLCPKWTPKHLPMLLTTDYERLVDRFGIRRSNEKFWSVFDNLNKTYLAEDPVRSGTLDLTRYSLEQK
jgi:Fatty acid cis/trans isomerase (CTI)